MPDISVVICAYTEERWHDLVAAVESVRIQSLPPHEIIVVVDHNHDLLERARSELSQIVILQNGESPGLAGARNTGVATATGAIVAFLDDDAIAAPDWLEQLCVEYDDPRVLGVGGSIEPLWPVSRPGWFPKEFDWVVGCTYRGMPQSTVAVRNLIGCNMSYRQEAFQAVGPFLLSPKCDETEFCIRVRQHWPQRQFIYKPQARVFHQVTPERATWRYFCWRCYFEGRSKAVVIRLVGNKDGLASERAYTLRTLPQGIVQGLVHTIRHRDKAGLMRALTIMAGLTFTTAGYLMGTIYVMKVNPSKTGLPNCSVKLSEEL